MTGPLVDRSSTSILNTAVGQETSQGDLWSRATGTLEPTIGLEPMTCRLRIVQADGRRRNPNRLHSRSSTKKHATLPHSAFWGHFSGH